MTLPAHPRIGIVVPTKDARVEPAARALATVRQTTAHLDIDLHAVEASGTDFRLSRSINRGIADAKDADAWVLLNDDAFMDRGWLDALIDAARAHPEVGIVGSVLRFADGRIQHAGAHFPLTPLEFIAEGVKRRAPFWAMREIRRRGWSGGPFMYAHWHRVSPRHRLDFVTGACALVTRACMDKIGGYDEEFFFGFEDADHSLRALEAGFEIGLATRATGMHLEGASGREMSEAQKRSEETFRQKWSRARIEELTRKNGRIGVYHG